MRRTAKPAFEDVIEQFRAEEQPEQVTALIDNLPL
jgi:hypothetical protein